MLLTDPRRGDTTIQGSEISKTDHAAKFPCAGRLWLPGVFCFSAQIDAEAKNKTRRKQCPSKC